MKALLAQDELFRRIRLGLGMNSWEVRVLFALFYAGLPLDKQGILNALYIHPAALNNQRSVENAITELKREALIETAARPPVYGITPNGIERIAKINALLKTCRDIA